MRALSVIHAQRLRAVSVGEQLLASGLAGDNRHPGALCVLGSAKRRRRQCALMTDACPAPGAAPSRQGGA
jgi:hypothetical protein